MIEDDTRLNSTPWVSQEKTISYRFQVTQERGVISMALRVGDKIFQRANCSLEALACAQEAMGLPRKEVLTRMGEGLIDLFSPPDDIDRFRVVSSQRAGDEFHALLLRTSPCPGQPLWFLYARYIPLEDEVEIAHDRYGERCMIEDCIHREWRESELAGMHVTA